MGNLKKKHQNVGTQIRILKNIKIHQPKVMFTSMITNHGPFSDIFIGENGLKL